MKRSDAHAGGPHPLKTRNPDLRLRIVRIARILLPISLKCLSARGIETGVALRTPMRSRANRATGRAKVRGCRIRCASHQPSHQADFRNIRRIRMGHFTDVR